MAVANDMLKFFNYIYQNQHRGLFTAGYENHHNIIESFLIKDNTVLNIYSIFRRNFNFYPDMQNLLDIINFVNMQHDKHRRFCIQFWLLTFRGNEIAQLENQLRNIFLN